MKFIGLDTTWWENIKTGKQNPWEKLIANDVNNHIKHFKLSIKGPTQ
jgi:hypothetical protein